MREVEPLLEHADVEHQSAKAILQDLEWNVKRANLKLRDLDNKLRRRNQKAGEEASLLEQVIWLRDLSDVVIKDVGGKRGEDGRWPLIFDPSGQSVTFFKYYSAAQFDCDQLAVLSISEDKEEKSRLLVSLLKHMKYGMPLMINLKNDLANLRMVEDAFNCIQKGFFNTFTDRSVLYSYLLPRRFMNLVTPELEKEYCEYMFDDEGLTKFVLGFIMTANEPDCEVMQTDCPPFYAIKVKDPDAPDPVDPVDEEPDEADDLDAEACGCRQVG
ncbi:unnamed protein product [Polarella glacialis]|uniref:Uncharacterized protein n=1 Tax=Polarella glacialis TaxID=89957 RepID=A0A813G8C2_POLGL|nr:unnamed protein product [Polarella glacialis]